MPFEDINNYKPERKEDHSKTYIMAGIVGAGIFLVILISFKLLGVIVRFIIKNWMYVLGGIVGIFIIRKLFSKKRVIMEKEK